MLDVESCIRADVQPLTRGVDRKRALRLESVGQLAQLRDELRTRVVRSRSTKAPSISAASRLSRMERSATSASLKD